MVSKLKIDCCLPIKASLQSIILVFWEDYLPSFDRIETLERKISAYSRDLSFASLEFIDSRNEDMLSTYE